MSGLKIAGFLGFQGSGKDTAAQVLLDEGFVKFAFANTVKDLLALTFSWDRVMLDGTNPESRAWREKVDPWWAARLGIPHFTPRFAMQNIGTDVMRKHFHDDIWIASLERRILDSSHTNIVITDFRYPNEIALATRLCEAANARNGNTESQSLLSHIVRGPHPEFWQYSSLPDNHPKKAEATFVMQNLYSHVHSSEWAWNSWAQASGNVIENDGTADELRDKVRFYYGFAMAWF